MAKNIIPEIAKMLGVEFGEEFKIAFNDEDIYRFSEHNLEYYSKNFGGWINTEGTTLQHLICGECEIVKLPWKPKVGDYYWTFVTQGFVLVRARWTNDAVDFAKLKAGVIFRTEEEAIKARPKIYKELTGKEW